MPFVPDNFQSEQENIVSKPQSGFLPDEALNTPSQVTQQSKQGLLSKLGQGWNAFWNSPVGKPLNFILQAPEWALAGASKERFKQLKEQVGAGETPSLAPKITQIPALFKGAFEGLKEKKTIPETYLEAGVPKPVAYGAGLPLSFLIPSIPVGKIAKVTGIASKVGKLFSKIGEIPVPLGKYGTKLGEVAVPRYGQPEAYKKLARGTQAAIGMGQERAVELAKPFKKLSPELRELSGRILRQEAGVTPELEKLTEPVRQEFINWGQEAVKEGLLKESTFKQNFGKYLPRLYKQFEEGGKLGKGVGDYKPIRIDVSRFKARKDIPEDVREAMGEIGEAGYPTAKGLSQLAQAVTRAKFFRKVSENTEWASNAAKEGFEQLPTTNRLGKLSGKYVLAPIAHDIQEWIAQKGPVEQIASKLTGWWKMGKVVLNPATHGRNIMANAVLAHTIGGLPPTRVDVYLDALQDLSKKGEAYQEARKFGLLGSTYYGNEIKQMLNSVDEGKGITGWLKGRFKGWGNLYQAEEQWFKLALYKYQKSLGKNPEEAAKIAEGALFNYSEIPNSVKFLRENALGFPFLTFTYKAVPALAKAFMENPTRFAQYKRLSQAIEGLSPKEETKEERQNFPDWMRERTKEFLKLPLKDKYGRSQYLDLSYIYPWYSYGGLQLGGSPIASIPRDIVKNKDFLGNEIYKETDTESEKYAKITKYVWTQLAPPLAPGGYSFKKLSEAVGQKPDYLGRTRNLPQTIFDVFLGIKTQPFDLGEQKMWRSKEREQKLQDIRYELQKLLRSPSASPQEKQKAMKNYQIKSQDILNNLMSQ